MPYVRSYIIKGDKFQQRVPTSWCGFIIAKEICAIYSSGTLLTPGTFLLFWHLTRLPKYLGYFIFIKQEQEGIQDGWMFYFFEWEIEKIEVRGI